MSIYSENRFVFDPKLRLLRHTVFWGVHIIIFSFLFKIPSQPFWQLLMLSALWVPGFILYGYPIMYWLIPTYLLKEKFFQFSILLLLWAIGGFFFNYLFRTQVLFPVSDLIGYTTGTKNAWAVNSYLSMNVMAAFGSMIVLFKYWIKKQKEYLLAEKEKVNAELQLLKAQIHPHFLFNTLNSIYSFSLDNSDKTPQLILKLSSLLSYVLYDGRNDHVLLEKEMEIMKNYIDLEKERYGSRLEVSVNIEGDIKNKSITPLLLLPFLENAFKHGISEQLEKSWMSMDVSVKQNNFHCKIANSKEEIVVSKNHGIGIENVRKRLRHLYAGRHDLRLNDEEDFFVVSLWLELYQDTDKKQNS